MSKHSRSQANGNTATEATSTQSEAQPQEPVETTAITQGEAVNGVMLFKRNHPKNRCSYGIPGVPGIVVCQRDLFAGTTPVDPKGKDLGGMPESLPFPGIALVSPKADNKAAKAEAQAAKLAERAKRQAEKAEAQAAKLTERQAKADAALAAAKARVEAAAKAAAAKTEVPEPAMA